jgi:Carboxypeptidase regulatory-like domain
MVTIYGAATGFRFTDVGGTFQVDDVPCAHYSLSVAKPGFVSGQEQNRPVNLLNPIAGAFGDLASENPAGRPPTPAVQQVNLSPDAPRVQVSLTPTASVSGTVLDENNDPLHGVSVQAIAVKTTLSGPDYVVAQTTQTDDLGHYELLDLPPGDYLVRLAGESSSTRYFQGNNLNPGNDHRGMQPVYYPNADSESSASVLTLAPGSQTSTDFQRATEPAFDINGRLAGFVPQAWTRIELYRDGSRLPVGRAFVNLSTGQFRVTDVPRGSYALRVTQYTADPPDWLAAEQPITIAGEPISGLQVPLSAGVEIPVTVSYEAGAQEDGQITLFLVPQHSPQNARTLRIGQALDRPLPEGVQVAPKPAPSGNQAAQPRVLTKVVPDTYKLVVALSNGYVAAAKFGDADALHGEFPVGGAPAELHLIIRGDGATVEGKVTSDGKPGLGAWVYLIPKTGDAMSFKFGFGGQDGHYQITGVPPGDYRIRAWAGAPSTKELLSSGGDAITLQPSDKQTVDLEASPTQNTPGAAQ